MNPRITIFLEGGVVSAVCADDLPNPDGINVLIVDYDTDGADEVVSINEAEATFAVTGFEPMDPLVASDVRRAYDTWRLT